MHLHVLGDPAETATAPARPPRDGYTVRVSVLEQCQLRCAYCLPGSVVSPTVKRAWLRAPAHAAIATELARHGIRKVRFTGGEPLLRPDLVDIVAAWKGALDAAGSTAGLYLTTNGLKLPDTAHALRDAGLVGATVHLDTLDEAKYRTVMGPGSVADALRGLDMAQAVLGAAKLNMVVQRGVNDDELTAFLAFGAARGIDVRFIELMNTGSARGYVAETFMSGADIVARIAQTQPVEAVPRVHPADPSARYRLASGQTFGVIASDTQSFCDACDRVRVSASGQIRGCLYAPAGKAVLGPASGYAADAPGLGARVAAALGEKRSFHPLAAAKGLDGRQEFSMADVGG